MALTKSNCLGDGHDDVQGSIRFDQLCHKICLLSSVRGLRGRTTPRSTPPCLRGRVESKKTTRAKLKSLRVQIKSQSKLTSRTFEGHCLTVRQGVPIASSV
jgi:hypothetical protein